MRMKYMVFKDDHDKEIKRFNEDEPDDDLRFEYNPLVGEQIWLPNIGLYETQRVRYMLVDVPYIEIKLSFIRRNL